MNQLVTLTVDVPEDVHHSLTQFLDAHGSWDYNEVFAIALSRFLREEQGLRKVPTISPRKLYLPVLS